MLRLDIGVACTFAARALRSDTNSSIARSSTPREAPIARANGDFGRRPWDIASPAQITEAQRLLQRLGFNPGGSDGKMSTRTAEAIRNFQRENDLPVTGEASVSLLGQLRAATLNATE